MLLLQLLLKSLCTYTLNLSIVQRNFHSNVKKKKKMFRGMVKTLQDKLTKTKQTETWNRG